uniref:Apple domain-containing protein n=1 Tax=Pyrodinium bahamense TaxID=73915 RepID=A0A7S0FPU6_9DINO
MHGHLVGSMSLSPGGVRIPRVLPALVAAICLCPRAQPAGGPTGEELLAGLASAGLNPAVFEEGFCASPASVTEVSREAELNTNSMDCAKLMEFVYISRLKLWEHMEKLRADVGEDPKGPLPWRLTLHTLSRGSSLLSAHVHVLAAISSQRAECFSEHVRLLLIVNLRRTKSLVTGHLKQLWLVGQDGPEQMAEGISRDLRKWLEEAAGLLDADLRTLRAVLRTWRPPAMDEARFYSHEADGRFSTMEVLRRDTFDEWQLDKGLLQGLIRHVLPIDGVVADFGAGSGHYASWLNDTGLITAHAFDGSPDIELVTKGTVQSADLGRPLTLWRKFDWVLCLEVAEHIPPDLTGLFLRNLDEHTGEGLVLSWARPGLQGLGSTNPQSEAEVLSLLSLHTGLHLDHDLTAQVRASSQVAHLAESLLVFVRAPRAQRAGGAFADAPASEIAPGCAPEDGWIYAGNDVQMYNDVASAAACCELCSSNELCRFWTWSREDGHKNLCWIKATREYRINHAGFVSGARALA